MKQFILEVQEGKTNCIECPFFNNNFNHICLYLYENKMCCNYDFSQINIEEYNENRN